MTTRDSAVQDNIMAGKVHTKNSWARFAPAVNDWIFILSCLDIFKKLLLLKMTQS